MSTGIERSEDVSTYDSLPLQRDPSIFLGKHKAELEQLEKMIQLLGKPVMESSLTYKEVITKARLKSQLRTIPEAKDRIILYNAVKNFLNMRYKWKYITDIDNHYDLYDSLTNDVDKCYLYDSVLNSNDFVVFWLLLEKKFMGGAG